MVISKLEVIRRSKGLSASALLRQAGYNPNLSSSLEKRKRIAWPKLQQKISEVLGVEPGEIFDDEGFVREAKIS